MTEDQTPERMHFDVALSFAGENREVAEELARLLEGQGIRVFYDGYFKAEMWGKDLYEYLADVYEKRADYCLILVSKEYASKKWTAHERKNAQARAITQGSEYILPVRLDDTLLPGLPDTIAYIDLRELGTTEVAEILTEKIRGESESSLQRRAKAVESQFLKRAAKGLRFGCSLCDSTWRGPDNIHYCLHCQSVYCISCVHRLSIVPSVKKYRWRCRYGGRVD